MDKGDIYQTNNYGEIVVLEYIDSRHVRIRFLDTNYETTSTAYNVRLGSNIRDKFKPTVCGIGFTGEGTYGGISHKKAYKCWESMLYKCYDKSPTYVGCSVCETWHNFQNFAEWYYLNHKEGLELTRELKVYSPETCSFTTKTKNATLTSPSYTFKYSSTGRLVSTSNRAEFSRNEGLDASAVCRLVKGKQKTHKGWVFIKSEGAA